MAYFNETHTRTDGFMARVLELGATILHTLAVKAEKRRVRQATFNELAALSNRDLADMGIHRSQIRRIAIESARDVRV